MAASLSSSIIVCLTLVLQLTLLHVLKVDFGNFLVASSLTTASGIRLRNVALHTITLGENTYASYDKDSLVLNLGTGTATSSGRGKDCIQIDLSATYQLIWFINIPVSATAHVCGKASLLRTKASTAEETCTDYLRGSARNEYGTTTTTTSSSRRSSGGYRLGATTQDGQPLTNCCRAVSYDPASDCTLEARVLIYTFIPVTVDVCSKLRAILQEENGSESSGTREDPYPPLRPGATAIEEVALLRALKDVLGHVDSIFGFTVTLSFPAPTAVHVRVRRRSPWTPPAQYMRTEDVAAWVRARTPPLTPTLGPELSQELKRMGEQFLDRLRGSGMFDGYTLDGLLDAANLMSSQVGLEVSFAGAAPAGSGLDFDLVLPDLVCGDGNDITTCSLPRTSAREAGSGRTAPDEAGAPLYVANLATTGLSDIDLAIPKANHGLTRLLKKLMDAYLMPLLPCEEGPSPNRCFLFPQSSASGGGSDAAGTPPPPLLPDATPVSDVALFAFVKNISDSITSVANVSLDVDTTQPTALGLTLATTDAVDLSPVVALAVSALGLGDLGADGQSIPLPTLVETVMAGIGRAEGNTTTTTALTAQSAWLGPVLSQVELRYDVVPWAAALLSTFPANASASLDVFLSHVRCGSAAGMDCHVRVTSSGGGEEGGGLAFANLAITGLTVMDELLNLAGPTLLLPWITTTARDVAARLCGGEVCFVMNTTGVTGTVDAPPPLPAPPLLPGSTPVGQVAALAFLANITAGIQSVANLSLTLTSPADTHLQVVLATTGPLDLLADRYDTVKGALTALVHSHTRTPQAVYAANSTHASQGGQPAKDHVALWVLSQLQPSPFLDTWILDLLRHTPHGRGVRANILVDRVRCHGGTGLDCALLLRSSHGERDGTSPQALADAVTLADLQVRVHPVLDILVQELVPRLGASFFASTVVPALASSRLLCGRAAHAPNEAGSSKEEEQLCYMTETSSELVPVTRTDDLPSLFPGATPTSDAPLLLAIRNVAAALHGIPGVALEVSFPGDTGLAVEVNFTSGLTGHLLRGLAGSPLGAALHALVSRLSTRGSDSGVGESDLTVALRSRNVTLDTLLATPYTDALVLLARLLLSRVRQTPGGGGAPAGSTDHASSSSSSSTRGGTPANVLVTLLPLLEDVLHTVRVARDDSTDAVKTVGDFLHDLGPMGPGTAFGLVAYARGLRCGRADRTCVLLPEGVEEARAAAAPSSTAAAEAVDWTAVAHGVGLVSLQVTPSSRLGVLSSYVLPLLARLASTTLRESIMPVLCNATSGGRAAREGGTTGPVCHVLPARPRPTRVRPPSSFLVVYPILAVLASLGLSSGNVLRHRRHRLSYYVDTGAPVGVVHLLVEDLTYLLLLFSVAGLYIAAHTSSTATVVVGDELTLYSLSLFRTVADMWASGYRFAAACLVGLSGLYPYLRLLTMALLTVGWQRPVCPVMTALDALGKLALVDPFMVLVFANGLQMEGFLTVRVWPAHYLLLGATAGSMLAGNYGAGLYRRGTTARLPRKERRALLAAWRDRQEGGRPACGEESVDPHLEQHDGCSGSEGGGASTLFTGTDARQEEGGMVDPPASLPRSIAALAGGGWVGEASVARPPSRPGEDAAGAVPPLPPSSPLHPDHIVLEERAGEVSPGHPTSPQRAYHYHHRSGSDGREAGPRTEGGVAAVKGHGRRGCRLEWEPEDSGASDREGSPEDRGHSGSTHGEGRGKTLGARCLAAAYAYLRGVWWPVSLPAAATIVALTAPAWCFACVTYKVGGLAALLNGPRQSRTLAELATGSDGATAAVVITTLLVAPPLLALVYPRSAFIGSWAAADVIVGCLLATLRMNAVLRAALGDRDGNMEFLYRVDSQLHWPVVLLGIAALLVWGLQLTRFFKLRTRVPFAIRSIATRLSHAGRRQTGGRGRDLDASIAEDEVVDEA